MTDNQVMIQAARDRIEIANPYIQGEPHIVSALVLAGEKSEEKMYFQGKHEFIEKSRETTTWFNQTSRHPLPLTDKNQRKQADYMTLSLGYSWLSKPPQSNMTHDNLVYK